MNEIVKNACQCRICGASADRHPYGFQCTKFPGHVGDLNVGIFSDLTHPDMIPSSNSSMQTKIIKSSPPSVGFVLFVAIMVIAFAATTVTSIGFIVYALLFSTLTNLLGYIGLFAISYYLTRVFLKSYWVSAYNYALEEIAYASANGRNISTFAKSILESPYVNDTNQPYET